MNIKLFKNDNILGHTKNLKTYESLNFKASYYAKIF